MLAPGSAALKVITAAAALAHLLLAVIDRFRGHPTDNARQAAAFLGTVKLGPLRAWRDGLLVGVVLAIVLLPIVPVIAILPVVAGLFLYEHAYVRAGQLPPLS